MSETMETTWHCSHCGEQHEAHMTGCWKCGADKDGSRLFERGESQGEKKSPQDVITEYASLIKRVEQKQRYQVRAMGVLFGACLLLGVAQNYESTVVAIILAILCLLTLVVILFLRLTTGAIYRCPQCDAKLTLDSKKRGIFHFEVAPLSHCHHCGESLTK